MVSGFEYAQEALLNRYYCKDPPTTLFRMKNGNYFFAYFIDCFPVRLSISIFMIRQSSTDFLSYWYDLSGPLE
jgi:hypothetical protein